MVTPEATRVNLLARQLQQSSWQYEGAVDDPVVVSVVPSV